MVMSREERAFRRLEIGKDVAGGMSVNLACKKWNVSDVMVRQSLKEYEEHTGKKVELQRGGTVKRSRYNEGTVPVTLTVQLPALLVLDQINADEPKMGVIAWSERLEAIREAITSAGGHIVSQQIGTFIALDEGATLSGLPAPPPPVTADLSLQGYRKLFEELTKEVGGDDGSAAGS